MTLRSPLLVLPMSPCISRSSLLCLAIAGVATAIDHPSFSWAVSALEPHFSAAQIKARHTADELVVQRLNRELYGQGKIALESLENLGRQCGRSLVCPGTVTRDSAAALNNNLAWASISANGGDQHQPSGHFGNEINSAFGSFAGLKDAFAKAADDFFGAGFVVLVRRGDTHELALVATHEAESVMRQSHEPLLALSMWERAYFLDYGADRAKYAKAFLKVANWIHATAAHHNAMVLHGDVKEDL